MSLQVVGAGVGRTGTHSLKIALEQLLGGRCHHMMEMFGNQPQIEGWTDAIEGRPVDWHALLAEYVALVDWPGGSFWPELHEAFPDALVLLSVRPAEDWYKSASNTIFLAMDNMPPDMKPWMDEVTKLFHDRFSDDLGNPTVMMEAFERHNAAVRAAIPSSQLLEWRPGDGWEPICDRLGLPVPAEPFPLTNTTDDFRTMMGLPPIS